MSQTCDHMTNNNNIYWYICLVQKRRLEEDDSSDEKTSDEKVKKKKKRDVDSDDNERGSLKMKFKIPKIKPESVENDLQEKEPQPDPPHRTMSSDDSSSESED